MKTFAAKLISFSGLVMLALFFSCKPVGRRTTTVNRAMYYWKSVLKTTQFEKRRLDSLHVNIIYLKLFDVQWNKATNSPNPVAQLRIADPSILAGRTVIPTIFITNECIQQIDSSQISRTASRIMTLIREMTSFNKFTPVKEIEIDCDWTATTKDKYFSLLRSLGLIDSTVLFSVTIRLHQVKFMNRTGVPPVKKGLLMCYNMGNLKSFATGNSILESKELEKYTGDLQNYPLKLDIGLPIFEWQALFRNEQFTGLLEGLGEKDFNSNRFNKNGNRYRALADISVGGYEIRKDDIIRFEKSNYDELLETVALLKNRLKNNDELNVSLYHLDSLTLNKYPLYEIENIYSGLR